MISSIQSIFALCALICFTGSAQAQTPLLDDPSDYGWQRTDHINISLSDAHRDQICDLETALDGVELAERFGVIKADLADTPLDDLTLGEAFFHVECVYETGLATPLQLTGINHLRGRDYAILDVLLERYPKSLFLRKFLSYGSFLEQVTGVSVPNLVPEDFDQQQLASSPRPQGFYTQEVVEQSAVASFKVYYRKRAPDQLRSLLHSNLVQVIDALYPEKSIPLDRIAMIEQDIQNLEAPKVEKLFICRLARTTKRENFASGLRRINVRLQNTELNTLTLAEAIYAIQCGRDAKKSSSILDQMSQQGLAENDGIESRLKYISENDPVALIRLSPFTNKSFYEQVADKQGFFLSQNQRSIASFYDSILDFMDADIGEHAAFEVANGMK